MSQAIAQLILGALYAILLVLFAILAALGVIVRLLKGKS